MTAVLIELVCYPTCSVSSSVRAIWAEYVAAHSSHSATGSILQLSDKSRKKRWYLQCL